MPGRPIRLLAFAVIAFASAACASPPASRSGTPSPTPGVQVITGYLNNAGVLEPLHEVYPEGSANTVQLAVSFADFHGVQLGIEGAVLFLKASTPNGSMVLDRVVDQEGDLQALPPGDYEFVAYYRSCDGNCGLLDPPKEFCSTTQTLEPDRQYWLTVQVKAGKCVLASTS